MTAHEGAPGSAAPEGGERPEVVVLDARGLRCPLPVIRLAQRTATCAAGSVVVVRWTDPAAAVDIPAWARMRGHTVAQPGQDTYDDAVSEADDGSAEDRADVAGNQGGVTVVVLAGTTTGRRPVGSAGPARS